MSIVSVLGPLPRPWKIFFEVSRLGAHLGKNHIILSDALSICTSVTAENGSSLDLDKKKRVPFDTADGIAKS